MNDIFNKNYKMLRDYNCAIFFETEEYESSSDDRLIIEREGKKWNLQSKYDMRKPVQVWCDQFEKVSYLNKFMIFGMGDVSYVRELMHRYPDNMIIIFEPCEEILAKQMCHMDMDDIFTNENIKIVVGKQSRLSLEITFRTFVSYGDYDNILYASLPNYPKIFENEYTEYLQQIRNLVRREVMTRNTLIERQGCRGRNFLYNLERFYMESGIAELGKSFQRIDKTNCPAVLISAGPSLDKNIHVLKGYQDKVFIVCVDAAVRVAYKNGIKPDLLVTQDPKFQDPSVFENEYGRDIPILVALTSDYRIIEKNYARKFYVYEGESYIDDILEETNCEMFGLHSGGSVANTAFSFIQRVAGFKTIILIGQDLGYPKNRRHASDVFYGEKTINKEDEKDYFYVESIDGGQVLTEDNMNMYRLWFENVIEDYPELTIVDATEGGAMIHGTEILSLQEALEKYTDGKTYDFSGVINDAEDLFTDSEKEYIKKRIDKSFIKLDGIVEKLEAQREIYNQLDLLNRKGKYRTLEFQRCVEKISQFHEYTQKESEIELIRLYANKGEYQAMDELQAKESNVYDEIKLVVDSGRKLLDAYIEGGKELKREWMKIREEKI